MVSKTVTWSLSPNACALGGKEVTPQAGTAVMGMLREARAEARAEARTREGQAGKRSQHWSQS